MTYQQAISVRPLLLAGVKMLDSVVQEAIEVIQRTRTQTPWPTYGEAAAPSLLDVAEACGGERAARTIVYMDGPSLTEFVERVRAGVLA